MKIAIVKLSALGDIVHAMSVIQLIKKFDQKIKIDWIVDAGFSGILDFHPDIENIHKVNIKKANNKNSVLLLIKELLKVKNFGTYDLVIDMQGLLKSALISRLIGSPITVGFDKFSSREGFASIFYNKTFQCNYSENIIERNTALIEFALGINGASQDSKDKLSFLYSSQKYLTNYVSKIKKNIILVPGASHKSKRYPISSLVQLTTLIDANFLIIWGNSEEKIMAEEIKAQSPSVNICQHLNIDSLKSLISQVDLLIGPDTGPTHMAWALNTPSITLFGPTPGYRNACETKINRIIESNSKVNPFKIDKNDLSMKDIEVDKIVKVSKDLLNKK